jgi:hypothetical protein
LAHPAERHTNVRVSDIEFGQLDDYDISDAIRENFSFSKRLEEYLNYINSSVSPFTPSAMASASCLPRFRIIHISAENTSISCLCVRCAEIMRFYKNAPISYDLNPADDV